MSKLNSISQNGEIYHLNITAEVNQINAVMNDEDKAERFGTFLKEIYDDSTEKFIVDGSTPTAFDIKQKPFDKFGERYKDKCYVDTVMASPNFFEIFQVVGDFDRTGIEKLFAGYAAGQNIPVIMGSDFHRYFKTGDIFNDDLDNTYVVAGFFDKSEFYVAPFETGKAINLNKLLVVPDSAGELNFITLHSTYFRTDDTSRLEAIIAKSSKLELLPMERVSLAKQIQYKEADMMNEIMTMGSVMALIFIFASVGMVAYFIRFIQSRIREFAVHMICGARERDILIRIALQFVLILIVSMIAIICLFGLGWAFCITVIIGAVYCACIFVYLNSVIRQMSLVGLLRSNAK
jgi:ABC-type antimicrobial peptide transport system permease subunit